MLNSSCTFDQIAQLKRLLAHTVSIDTYFGAIGGVEAWESGMDDLRTFIVNRTAYLDTQLPPLPPTHTKRLWVAVGGCVAAVALVALVGVGVWLYRKRSRSYVPLTQ